MKRGIYQAELVPKYIPSRTIQVYYYTVLYIYRAAELVPKYIPSRTIQVYYCTVLLYLEYRYIAVLQSIYMLVAMLIIHYSVI